MTAAVLQEGSAPWNHTWEAKCLLVCHEISRLLLNPKFHLRSYKRPLLDHILRQINPMYNFKPHFKRYILTFTSRTPSDFYFWSNLACISHFCIRTACPGQLILFGLITQKYQAKDCIVHWVSDYFKSKWNASVDKKIRSKMWEL